MSCLSRMLSNNFVCEENITIINMTAYLYIADEIGYEPNKKQLLLFQISFQ